MSDDPTRLRDQASRAYVGCFCREPLLEAADRIEELREQAAEDIAWMSGIGPIPDEALDHWRRIQDRWLR